MKKCNKLSTRKRPEIDNTLHRIARKTIKKQIPSHVDPASSVENGNMESEVNSVRKLSVLDATKGHSNTEWKFTLAAVYGGDDWQESVADFVISPSINPFLFALCAPLDATCFLKRL